MEKPRILLLAERYLPGHKAGGALRAIVNLVAAQGNEFQFLIVAYDRDLGDPRPYPQVDYESWMPIGNAQIRHVRPGSNAMRDVGLIVRSTPHDLLYVNSFFDPAFGFSAVYSTQAPILLAPHGQLNLGALGQKPMKKRALLKFLRVTGSLKRVQWHSTDPSQTESILREFPDAKGSILELPLCFPPPPQTPPEKRPKENGRLKIAFLSRVVPNKNLRFAIESLREVKADVELAIYGNIEDKAYAESCGGVAMELSKNVSTLWKGPIPHDEVHAALLREHLYYLPTLSENFGYGIYEALCAGCPVLISDQTPWHGLQASQAGWNLPLHAPERFVGAIEEAAGWDQALFDGRSQNAWEAARAYYRINSDPAPYREAFMKLIRRAAA